MELLGSANRWAPRPLRRLHERIALRESAPQSACPPRASSTSLIPGVIDKPPPRIDSLHSYQPPNWSTNAERRDTRDAIPGVTFTLGGPIDAHHNQARFQWHAGPAAAPDSYVGFDVIVAEDGRIRNVYGFMDAAPAA